MKTNNIIISYWFKPLDYNPITKIQELEKSLDDFIKPCLVSNAPICHNLNIPRIQTTNKERNSFFSISMINCIVNLNVKDKDSFRRILSSDVVKMTSDTSLKSIIEEAKVILK